MAGGGEISIKAAGGDTGGRERSGVARSGSRLQDFTSKTCLSSLPVNVSTAPKVQSEGFGRSSTKMFLKELL